MKNYIYLLNKFHLIKFLFKIDMKYTLQLEGPLNTVRIIVFPLSEDHYQSAQEFIKLHGHAPTFYDITFDDSNRKEFDFMEESEHINIKILDENSLIVSEFKLYDLDHLPLTWAENEVTHHIKYFWEKYGDNKPCLIHRMYEDVHNSVIVGHWGFEFESEDLPKKKDFAFKTVGVEVRDFRQEGLEGTFWNCIEKDKSIFYKQKPLKKGYYYESFEQEFLDCFLLDSKGDILKDFYGRY